MLVLLGVGVLVGVSTAWFGFGGGFVAVPVITWADSELGTLAVGVATATSLLVMLTNAVVATAATPRPVLAQLHGRARLLIALGLGGCAGAVLGAKAPGAILQWGFVAYVAVTVIDLMVRPGFLTPRRDLVPGGELTSWCRPRPLSGVSGVLIGAIAAFLGVGGSVMTVPAMRRTGMPMAIATALANPLTVAIVAPASIVMALTSEPTGLNQAGMLGRLDVPAAAALLLGALPVVTALRRLPVPLSDRAHAWVYLVLLLVSGAAVALH